VKSVSNAQLHFASDDTVNKTDGKMSSSSYILKELYLLFGHQTSSKYSLCLEPGIIS